MPDLTIHAVPDPLLDTITARLRDAGCVYAEDEARLLRAAGGPDGWFDLVERRAAGWPLEYVVGRAEFCGLSIAVDAGVFIPRRRTEFLAMRAVGLARPASVVLDLCCGSGAVGAVIAARVADIRLVASDVAPAAVRCARGNLAGFGAQTREGDLYAPLPAALAGRVDVLVVNAPYVPTGEIERLPREARLYEPRGTYDGGSDGHDIQRRVAADAARWLAAGGHLLIETGEHQAAETADLVRRAGLRATVARSDDLDATVVIGTRR